MKISNVRLGFATNSSSVHSIVLISPGCSPSDSWEPEPDGKARFGWDRFHAVSSGVKRTYLAAALFQNLVREVGYEIAAAVVRDWLGTAVPQRQDYYSGIDHQSLWDLPREWDGKGLNREFFEDLTKFILQDRIAILGGNDSDSELSPMPNWATEVSVPIPDDARDTYVARKDGRWWVLFNRATGAKVRLSFDLDAPAYTKSTAPELVDLKLTGACCSKCSFCYQGSTPDGKHADDVTSIIYALGELQVFEVALGGGEPTAHPKFVSILETLAYAHIKPSFSTRSLTWLIDPEARGQILPLIGAFAYSAQTVKEADRFFKLVRKYSVKRAALHHVVGTASEYELDYVITATADHNAPITLLGYKSLGRGTEFTPIPVDLPKVLKRVVDRQRSSRRYARIGIDTVLASQYKDALEDLFVSDLLYTTEEGKFSCYIDAVGRRIGPSSFCPPEQLVALPEDCRKDGLTKAILEAYKGF